MKPVLYSLLIAAAASLQAFAQDGGTKPEAQGALGRRVAKAQATLESGDAELVEARRQIEAEKIPLDKELSELEDAMIAARKTYDERRKLADTLRLEASNLNLETKVRADENGYLANLLDEFVRGFEGKVFAGEAKLYSGAINDAKLAVENPNLTETDRFQKRLDVLHQSVARLKEVIGGKLQDAEALDPQGVLVQGKMALIGPVAVFGTADKATFGVLATQSGSAIPLVRALDKEMNAGIAQLVETGKGLLPFDPTRGAALQELIKKTSLIDTFLHGGPIMWPILFCSIVALAVSIERVFCVLRVKSSRKTSDIDAIYELAGEGAFHKATELGAKSKDFVARMLGYALSHGHKSLHTAIQRGSGIEVKKITRGLWLLDTCITMAPLLGLLGTVTGMMGSFDAIGRASDAASGANSVIGGIAEALIATAAGLLIAIMALIPLNYMNEQIEGVQHELDDAGRQLELILNPAAKIIIAEDDDEDGPPQRPPVPSETSALPIRIHPPVRPPGNA